MSIKYRNRGLPPLPAEGGNSGRKSDGPIAVATPVAPVVRLVGPSDYANNTV